MMGYSNYDARQAGKDNRALKEYKGHILGLYLCVDRIYCKSPWYYQVLALGSIMVCGNYNSVVLKILGGGWVNPRILSIQSLEAHHHELVFNSCLILDH